MNGTVGHNTEEMRRWSGDINNASGEYESLISEIYNAVDRFVSSDFTGGISGHLEEQILSQRANFQNLSECLQEFSKMMSDTSANIDEDENYLRQKIQSSDILG